MGVLSAEAEGDPHFWQNPLFAIRYVERIRDGMVEADPGRATLYRQNAETYILELRRLDAEIAERLAEVPRERRRLVTFHDAFGHFGERYGWRLTSLVSQGAGDVTPRALVNLLEILRDEGVPAVFAEPQFSEGVLRQAAGDAGVSVETIYSDALSEDVSTYIEMMRFNANSLVEGLRS
jgi:zinc/manganese transport system substrate-binding protein/manganese/iron transport system substrate-binding protein